MSQYGLGSKREKEEITKLRDLEFNLPGRIKYSDLCLLDFKPDFIDYYSKFIGNKLTKAVIIKLIAKGIKEISMIEMGYIQKFPITNCFEGEKNKLIIGAIAQEKIISKENKTIIEQGQKISNTKLNRLFSNTSYIPQAFNRVNICTY